jgi:WD40 repeat protein
LSGNDDHKVTLQDAATGRPTRTFEGEHSEPVNFVVFSHDNFRVLSLSGGITSENRRVAVWNAATGRVLRSFKPRPNRRITASAFAADGTRLVLADFEMAQWPRGKGKLELWDAVNWRMLRSFDEGRSDYITSVAFSLDGTRVASADFDGSKNGTLMLWDAATGDFLRSFAGDYGRVASTMFSPDGRLLLSVGEEGTLRWWDTATGQLVRAWRDEVRSVAFSPDGSKLLSGHGGGTLKLWDTTAGRLLRTFEGHSRAVGTVAVSSDGTRLLSGENKAVRLWEVATGRVIHSLEGNVPVAFSADGRHLVAGSRADATDSGGNSANDQLIKLWDAKTGRFLRALVHSDKRGEVVMSVAFSPDGTRLLSGGNTSHLKLWDVETGRLVRTISGKQRIVSIAFSRDGNLLLTGSNEGWLELWDVATDRLVRTIQAGRLRGVYAAAISPDGERLLSGGDDRGPHTGYWRAMHRVYLWDAATGNLLRAFDGHSDVITSVAFSPKGTEVLSGSADSTFKVWNAASGKLLRTFEGPFNGVRSVVFSPDGALLLTGNGDATVRVWRAEGEPATRQPLASFIGSRGSEWLAMTPAGFFAASPKGGQALAIVRGLGVTSIEQVHQSLFNPDLVREALAGDPGGEVRQAAQVINLEKVIDSGPAPIVTLTSPAVGSRSAGDLITVTARIQDRGKGIGRIEWRVNGITVAVAAKPPGSGPTQTITQQLALDPGDNIVEVVAYNASNLLASLPARITIKFTGPADKTKAKLHILAIGINAYVDRGSPLRFDPLGLAVKDATAFGAAMKQAAGGLYQEVRVILALDSDATRDKLEKTVDKIAREVHPRDSFILFAAGHGTSDNGRFYFIPQDYQSGPGNLERGAIGQDRLQDWLANRIKAKRVIILLDTCESGALVAGHARPRADAPASEAAVGRLHEATGRPVLTAAAAGQFAHEGLIGGTGDRHGVFTWALFDALRNGDTDGNGTIELSELVRHVQNVVPKIAADLGGKGRAATSEPVYGKQAARFGSRGEDFALVERLQ